MRSPQHSARRWFLLAGEGEYAQAPGLAALEHVPRELAVMRTVLAELGMEEIGPPAPGAPERGLHEVPTALGEWLRDRRAGEEGNRQWLSVLVYCTGHGITGDAPDRWGLAYPDHTKFHPHVLTPFDIARPLLGSSEERVGAVDQLVLFLDSCFSGKGSSEGVRDIASVVSSQQLTAFDTWLVASARSGEEARQLAFARAVKEAVGRQDEHQEFIEPSALVATVNRLMGEGQQVWGDTSSGRRCQVLPNPSHMPDEHVELDRQWGEWDRVARGVARDSRDPGWYFGGRTAELAHLRDYLAGTLEPGPLVLRGVAGSGKSALLAFSAAMGISGWRRHLPPIVRRRGLPLPAGSVHAVVTAEMATLDVLARRIGRSLGVELPAEASIDDLLDGLEPLPPRGILVDDVQNAAADPYELVTELLEPLTEHVKARIVVAARPDVTADAAWRRAKLPILPLLADPEGVRAYVGSHLHYGRRSPYRGRNGHPHRERDAVAAASQGNYGAAADAVTDFFDGAGDLRAARRAASNRLRPTYRDALAAGGLPQAWVQAMLEPAAAAAAAGAEAGLTADHWVALALAMTPDAPVAGPPDVEEAVRLLGPGVTALAADGRPVAWRLALPEEPGRGAAELADAALRCLRGPGGEVDWARGDPGMVAVFADAARHEPDRYATHFASPAFWLALPAETATRLARHRDRAVTQGLGPVLESLPPRSTPGARAFRLKTALMRSRSGGADLDIRRFGSPADVVWTVPEEEPPLPDLLATAEDERQGHALTTHTDGSLRLWDLSTGATVATLGPSDTGGHISSVALAIIGGEPVAAASTGNGGLLWRPLRSGRAAVEPLGLLTPRAPFDLHADGRLAVAHGAVVEIADVGGAGHPTVPSLRFNQPVASVLLVGPPGDVRLVTAASGGQVATRPMDRPGGSRGLPLLLPRGQLAISPSGRTLAALDHGGRLSAWDADHLRSTTATWSTRDEVSCVAAGDVMCATAGGRRNPWLALHVPGRGGEPSSVQLPLLDPPVGLAFSRDGNRLVVADSRGLVCLDVGAATAPEPTDRSRERS